MLGRDHRIHRARHLLVASALLLGASCTAPDGPPANEPRPDGTSGGAAHPPPAAGQDDDAGMDRETGQDDDAELDVADLDTAFTSMDTTAGSFLDLNGWMWFYTTADGITYTEITDLLDELHSGGIRVIGIYAPYDGDPGKWLGAVPTDYYATPPADGTLDELAALIDAAHGRGMKVVSYFGNVNIDRSSDFFTTAEEQYAAGDRTSPEVSAFHWADDDRGELPTPAFGPSEWAWSETAGAWYWSFWGEPGFDLDLPGARAEVERIETFWLDTGLDGFMFDSGVADASLQEAMVGIPTSHTPNDKWLTFEATDAERADLYAGFGLTSWFNLEDNDEENDYSIIADGDAVADDLEEALAGADEVHAAGKLTHAWSPWEPDAYPDDAQRPQEAALLAGGGIAYGAPSWTEYREWPEAVRAAWHAVLTAVADNPALAPRADRRRLPTGDDPKAYALIATSADGAQTALGIYNLRDTPATVAVDLSGSGIEPQDPVPLAVSPGLAVGPVTAASYPVELPAHGFALLQVDAGPAPAG